MTVRVACHCGHITRARAELAGKDLACPACGRMCPVPRVEADPSRPAAFGEGLCSHCRKVLPTTAVTCPECGQESPASVTPSYVLRPEREIGLTVLAVSVFLFGVGAFLLSEGRDTTTVYWIALVAMAVTPIVLLGTRTRFDIVHEADGPRLRERFLIACLPFVSRETKLVPVRKARISYEECRIGVRSWVLALTLGLLGILPGLFYAYFLACQRPQSDDEYGMQGVPYEMHDIGLIDGDGNTAATIGLRREKQVRMMLQMIASAVDIEVERA